MMKHAKTGLEVTSKRVASVYKLKLKDFWRGTKRTIRHGPPHPEVVIRSLREQEEALKKWHAEKGKDPTLPDHLPPCHPEEVPEHLFKTLTRYDLPIPKRRQS